MSSKHAIGTKGHQRHHYLTDVNSFIECTDWWHLICISNHNYIRGQTVNGFGLGSTYDGLSRFIEAMMPPF